jgi:hypothetical protein
MGILVPVCGEDKKREERWRRDLINLPRENIHDARK